MLCPLYNSLNNLHQRRFLVQLRSDLYLTFSLGFTIQSNLCKQFLNQYLQGKTKGECEQHILSFINADMPARDRYDR